MTASLRTHLFSIVALAAFASAAATAQQPPAQGRGGGAGRIGGVVGGYPQRQGDAAAIDRGRGVYSTYCSFCHGQDTRGGDGGPSLLRSQLVLDDQSGELVGPVVLNGRVDRGMPKFMLTVDQIADVAAFLHSFRVNGYDQARNTPPTIVVGDAKAGEAYFKSNCGTCHTGNRDLRGIATRIANARTLQQLWLMPDSVSGRGNPTPSNATPPRAVVTLPSGQKIEGELERLDDFAVSVRTDAGVRRSWTIVNRKPKVDVIDPLRAHRELLPIYSDTDIHNVTAYLVTLK